MPHNFNYVKGGKVLNGPNNKILYLNWLKGLGVGDLVGVVNTKQNPITVGEVEKVTDKWVYINNGIRYNRNIGNIEGAVRGDLSIRIVPLLGHLEEFAIKYKFVKYLLAFYGWNRLSIKDLEMIVNLIKETVEKKK